ncbi:ParA family protein [Streptomyces violaceusniger]|uniref:ParA family protein n=1 Tax=Streptomyces violaceusniger TaxID=68280 RepID=UPI00381A085A
MARVHATVNRKGGVGKSFLAVSCAAVVAEVLGPNPDGSVKVAVASADPQGTTLWRAAQLSQVPFDTLDISSDVENIQYLKSLPYTNVFVDTPGWTPPTLAELEQGANPFGENDKTAAILDAVFSQTDDAMVPTLCEPDCYEPTEFTIERVLRPRRIPYVVVVNKWLPGKEDAYVDGTKQWCERHGYPVANTAPRRYRVHANAQKLVTEYHDNRAELQARLDIVNLAMEHGLTRAAHLVRQLEAQERALPEVHG